MKKINNDNLNPVDGSLVVPKSKAGKLLKEHGNKVINGDVDSFVSLKNINKIYPNGVQAVYDFNIDIEENDFIVLVGPSGCGKSTTLRMIAGLEDITSGYLYIDKVLSNYLPSKNRDISMVFQSYALYPQMTVYDNIAFPLKSRKYRTVLVAETSLSMNEALRYLEQPNDYISALREATDKGLDKETKIEYVATKLNISEKAVQFLVKNGVTTVESLEELSKNGVSLHDELVAKANKLIEQEVNKFTAKGYIINEQYEVLEDGNLVYINKKLTKEEIRRKVFEAAEILDLGPYLDRRPKELSGGQMQRVALGRAIVRNAKLFLMDEPLSNLDAKLRVQMRSEIVRIHEQIGATTIYVTHDQTEAMTMATKIAVMSKGWVQQIGTPNEIYYNPKNIFVATFIGSPAMNIFDGEYDNGVVTFNGGYKVQLDPSFVKKHDDFYREKIADLERMLNLDDFKKMHALRILDEALFAENDYVEPENIGKAIQEVIQKSSLLGHECHDYIVSKLEGFANKDLHRLINEYNLAMSINAKNKVEELNEVVSTISDSYGRAAASMTSGILTEFNKIDTQDIQLPVYLAFAEAVKEVVEYVKALGAGNKSLLSLLSQLDITERISKSLLVLMREIRRPLLSFDKIASTDIGKLHNAQVFSKKEVLGADTLYYQKPKKNKKTKPQFKVNLNSVDVEFINNLYCVAVDLLESYKQALTGKHNVRIGIRPEDIHLNNEYTAPNKSSAFTISSDIVELLGSELLIHTQFTDSKLIAKISTGTLIKPHTQVELTMNRDKILLFDESCGDTI